MRPSLFSAIWNHVLDTVLGRKYYFVIMHYPNQRVRFADATIRPVPLHETSSNIFFTAQDAHAYCERFRSNDPSEYIVTDEVHSFRSHLNIPAWSRYLDNQAIEQGQPSRII